MSKVLIVPVMDKIFSDEDLIDINEYIIDAINSTNIPKDSNGFSLGYYHIKINWIDNYTNEGDE